MGRLVIKAMLNLGAASLAIAALADNASSDSSVAECPPPLNVAAAMSLRQLPEPVLEALREKVGDIEDRDGPFDVGDVWVTGHHRRFMFAWHRGERWVVATERGGIAYSQPVFAYDLRSTGKPATVAEEIYSQRDTLCKVAAETLRLPSSHD